MQFKGVGTCIDVGDDIFLVVQLGHADYASDINPVSVGVGIRAGIGDDHGIGYGGGGNVLRGRHNQPAILEYPHLQVGEFEDIGLVGVEFKGYQNGFLIVPCVPDEFSPAAELRHTLNGGDKVLHPCGGVEIYR